MAFCILTEFRDANIDWKDISDKLNSYKEDIEIFPIPKNKFSEKNYLGVSMGLPINEKKKTSIVSTIEYLLSLNCKIMELYSHKEFTSEGYLQLINLYFK